MVAQDIRGRLEALGYEVAGVAYAAGDAVALAGDKRPDLVLMDIRLRGRTDGIEAASEIRGRLGIPSVFLTAYADDETLRRAGAAEPLGYLMKPFQDRELRAAIEMALYKHRAESALRDSELRFRTLVQMAPDPIVMADAAGGISLWNRAAETLFGFSAPEMSGRPLAALLDGEDRGRGAALLSELARKGELRGVELGVPGRNGEAVPAELSLSSLRNDRGDALGMVAIFRDIAERRRARRELMSRLMDYELEEGGLYLVKESAPLLSLQCFRELLRAGYRGAHLSRSPPGLRPQDDTPPHEFRWISRRPGGGALGPDLSALEAWFEGLRRNTAVLLDRLDYLVSENGFDESLRLVHRLRELAYVHGHIILLSVDPATLPPTGLPALEKETAEVRTRSARGLPEDMLEVLRLVYRLNATGVKPAMREICSELRLSRPTARKRLRSLVRTGHVLLGASGRTKVVELSEKGRRVFLN